MGLARHHLLPVQLACRVPAAQLTTLKPAALSRVVLLLAQASVVCAWRCVGMLAHPCAARTPMHVGGRCWPANLQHTNISMAVSALNVSCRHRCSASCHWRQDAVRRKLVVCCFAQLSQNSRACHLLLCVNAPVLHTPPACKAVIG
ncbi:hypothetical protein COO60DRAFT_1523634 [Scenedesmus sp. NREL 46B-D3]|nr:hypothetical protein COO60DRAFT_1523634 [Scenedesmus sp. NREL 46B-D3]